MVCPHHVFVAPPGRVGREKVVFGKGVDDPPQHDDPRVEVLLRHIVACEETGPEAEHDQEDQGVTDKGRACQKVYVCQQRRQSPS